MKARRVISIILMGLLFAGCTKAVQVPVDQIDSSAQVHGMSHRITMGDGSSYAVDRFSTTDSTVVITKLNQADTRYKHVDLPIVLNREDIKSLERLELDQGKSFFVLVPVGLAVLFIIIIISGGPFIASS